MKRGSMAALQAGLLVVAMFASAASKSDKIIRIRVLDSETSSVRLDESDIPKNCDQINFDAYCHNAKTTEVTNTVLVQEGNGPPFRVFCTVDSKWSKCISLPEGESFDAIRQKRGIDIFYEDDNGKPRKQFYAFVDPNATGNQAANAATEAGHPGVTAAQSTTQAPPAAVAAGGPREKVKCTFSSIPSGAEVTLDGRYIGSTPSVLGLSTGSHVVVMSLPGFAQWKRELAVSSGSELTVNAVLQKLQ